MKRQKTATKSKMFSFLAHLQSVGIFHDGRWEQQPEKSFPCWFFSNTAFMSVLFRVGSFPCRFMLLIFNFKPLLVMGAVRLYFSFFWLAWGKKKRPAPTKAPRGRFSTNGRKIFGLALGLRASLFLLNAFHSPLFHPPFQSSAFNAVRGPRGGTVRS